MRLSELKTGESATILKVTGHGGFRRRIMEMGFVRGQRVEVLLNAPLKDPIEYKIMGYDISLRRTEADMVVVLSDSEVNEYLAGGHHHHRHHPGHRHGQCGCGTPEQAPEYPAAGMPGADDDCATADEVISRHSRTIGVALVGNPNSGKTSLFNAISGGHEHVGNYSGVTVGAKSGHRYYRGYRFEVTDLPGTYALSAYTPEERYVRSHIAEKTPDVIINSVVASNLERNLYLTTELIDINPRMVVALNMYDELDSRGSELDYDNLGRMLGVPMVPVEARNGKGIEALLDTVIAVYENQDERVRHIHINMGPVIEEGLRRLKDDMSDYRGELPKAFPPRYYAMKMLEGDRQVEEQLRELLFVLLFKRRELIAKQPHKTVLVDGRHLDDDKARRERFVQLACAGIAVVHRADEARGGVDRDTLIARHVDEAAVVEHGVQHGHSVVFRHVDLI